MFRVHVLLLVLINLFFLSCSQGDIAKEGIFGPQDCNSKSYPVNEGGDIIKHNDITLRFLPGASTERIDVTITECTGGSPDTAYLDKHNALSKLRRQKISNSSEDEYYIVHKHASDHPSYDIEIDGSAVAEKVVLCAHTKSNDVRYWSGQKQPKTLPNFSHDVAPGFANHECHYLSFDTPPSAQLEATGFSPKGGWIQDRINAAIARAEAIASAAEKAAAAAATELAKEAEETLKSLKTQAERDIHEAEAAANGLVLIGDKFISAVEAKFLSGFINDDTFKKILASMEHIFNPPQDKIQNCFGTPDSIKSPIRGFICGPGRKLASSFLTDVVGTVIADLKIAGSHPGMGAVKRTCKMIVNPVFEAIKGSILLLTDIVNTAIDDMELQVGSTLQTIETIILAQITVAIKSITCEIITDPLLGALKGKTVAEAEVEISALFVDFAFSGMCNEQKESVDVGGIISKSVAGMKKRIEGTVDAVINNTDKLDKFKSSILSAFGSTLCLL